MPPRPPRSILVLGTINAVVGGVSTVLIGIILAAYCVVVVPHVATALGSGATFVPSAVWRAASQAMAAPLAWLLLASGIGLLGMRTWARSVSLVYVVIAIAWGFCAAAVDYRFQMLGAGMYPSLMALFAARGLRVGHALLMLVILLRATAPRPKPSEPV